MAHSIKERRVRQVLASIPHYLDEVRSIRDLHSLYAWSYFKLPYAFPLQDFPLRLNLEPTNECNFRCPHCPRTVFNSGRNLGFMDVELFSKIAEESAPHRPTLKLVGLGEPALHPELPAMMEMLREHQIRTMLYTNGTLLERYEHQSILGWNFAVMVVSVDGTDEPSFEKLRLGGNYLELRRALAAFRSARDRAGLKWPQIEIRHVIMPNETPDMLAEFRRAWMDGLGDVVTYNALQPAEERHRVEDPSRPRCRAIRREIYIRFDGRVQLCACKHDEWLGDLHEMSIAQAWHQPRIEEVREKHKRRDLSELPFCRSCAFR